MATPPEPTYQFTLAGAREVLDADRASSLLSQLLQTPPLPFASIKLSNKSFTPASAPIAAAALAPLARDGSLTHLSIADVIASQPEADALRVLEVMAEAVEDAPGLVSLDVSDNALGRKGVNALSKALTGKPKLEHVYFKNNGLAADAATLITGLLLENPNPAGFKTIQFYNNLLECAGAVEIAPLVKAATGLENFRFSSVRCLQKGGASIIGALASCPNLKYLDISDGYFDEQGGEIFARSLETAKPSKLIHINLNDTALSHKGAAAALLAIVEFTPFVQFLGLASNDLGPAGGHAVAEILKTGRLSELREIKLADNDVGTQAGTSIIDWLTRGYLENMESVDLSGNGIGDAALDALLLAEKRLPALKSINLDGNAFSEAVIESLKEAFGDRLEAMDENDVENERVDSEEDLNSEEEGEKEESSAAGGSAAGEGAQKGAETAVSVEAVM